MEKLILQWGVIQFIETHVEYISFSSVKIDTTRSPKPILVQSWCAPSSRSNSRSISSCRLCGRDEIGENWRRFSHYLENPPTTALSPRISNAPPWVRRGGERGLAHRKSPSRENSAHRPNIMRAGPGDRYGNATRVHTCLDFKFESCQGRALPATILRAFEFSTKLNWMIAHSPRESVSPRRS